MKIYTRRGDQGMTDLVGGVRIRKDDIRLEAYGTVDELSSHLGLLCVLLGNNCGEECDMIRRIQNNLFNIGSYLATDQTQTKLYDACRLPDNEVALLEAVIDKLMQQVPETRGFILPGGTLAAAQAHVCRTVCRRMERCILTLSEQAEIASEIFQYVNRLSDFLFVLAKKINFNAGQQEILWQNACK